ncbi:MAG: thermonuclease family protein [Clostridia bacterium]|nr:thermonuclease family protein [Clostridia bacterium]
MKTAKHLLSFLLLLCILLVGITSCGPDVTPPAEDTAKDFAAEIKLDMSSTTLKQEVTVKAYIDGDTTHFNVPNSVAVGGVLKARYLAVNTPESTGKIEEWGKAASQFTKEKLQSATAILVESDTEKWNMDSTGDRHLVWVWYKTSESEDWRNLNIELLQNGLAIASNSANNRYGETCMAAINQAKAQKLHVYSGQKDPNFPYGEAAELTLKELRCNITDYDNSKVAFEGVITKNHNNSVYVEEYDSETDMYYGMTVYYGYALNGTGLEILSVGNRVRIVGTVTYYETGGTYQVSGLEYSTMRPKDPNNIQKISDGHTPAYVPTSADTFANGKITIAGEESSKTYTYAELAIYSSIEMKNLVVKSVYTTDTEGSSSNGAMTLTCEVDGITVSVRTTVLRDAAGKLITADYFENKTIDVKGLIDCFSGEYQIKVFSVNDVTIH